MHRHRSHTLRHGPTRGFTLVEIMVVVVILGLLGTLVASNVVGNVAKAQQTVVKTNLTAIDRALDLFYANNGRFPASLEYLVTPDENGHSYLKQRFWPEDPWGLGYIYEPPTSGEPRPKVYTLGRDGLPGGEGEDRDLSNLDLLEGRV